jgi:hypothetical protein
MSRIGLLDCTITIAFITAQFEYPEGSRYIFLSDFAAFPSPVNLISARRVDSRDFHHSLHRFLTKGSTPSKTTLPSTYEMTTVHHRLSHHSK